MLTLQQLREDAIKIRNKKKIEEILEQYPGIHPKLLFKNIHDDPELQSKNWFLQLFLDKVQMLAKLFLIKRIDMTYHSSPTFPGIFWSSL